MDIKLKINFPGFLTLLTLLLITLKLTKVIAWAWWIVTAPIWIPLSLVILGLVVIFLFAGGK